MKEKLGTWIFRETNKMKTLSLLLLGTVKIRNWSRITTDNNKCGWKKSLRVIVKGRVRVRGRGRVRMSGKRGSFKRIGFFKT
jgi:hypothetical protein